MYYEQKENLYPFLFMGCWNKEGAERNAVLAAIKKEPGEPLLVLGGDNAYPDKGKGKGPDKGKHFLYSEVKAGIRLLPDRLLVALGNHNVDPHPVAGAPEGSTILNVERDLFGPALPSPYYCVVCKDKRALVIVDTNLLAEDAEKDTMLDWLEKTLARLKKSGHTYYLVQHEPFFSLKPPKKAGLRVTQVHNGTDLLDRMAAYPPIAVLCADTHNYQEWDLTYGDMTVRQIVVGTGGASPDPVPELRDMPANYSAEGTPFSSIRNRTKGHRILGYGFYRLDSDLESAFHLVRPWPPGLLRLRAKSVRAISNIKYLTRPKARRTVKRSVNEVD